MLAAAVALLVLAGCTSSGQQITVQTADGTSTAGVGHFGTRGPSENLGSIIPAPPGAITMDYAHPQRITLAVGQSRSFNVDPGLDGFMHPLGPKPGSTPGLVRIDQTGAGKYGAHLTGTITAAAPGTVILQAPSQNMEASFTFVLTVRVLP